MVRAAKSGQSGLADAIWGEVRLQCQERNLLAALRPENLEEERKRLVALADRGNFDNPRWVYTARKSASEPASGATDVPRAGASPEALLAAERREELRRERMLAATVGTADFATHVRARAILPAALQKESHALASEWTEVAPQSKSTGRLSSDDLLRRTRAHVSALGLSFRVRQADALQARAATGAGAIYVAAGLQLTEVECERIALHEVYGHAVPREVARRSGHPMLQWGAPGGEDAQEGLALWVEARAGLLDTARRFELGLRHQVASEMLEGQALAEAMQWMVVKRGVACAEAMRICERVYRGAYGAPGQSVGLGRERAYLPAYLEALRLEQQVSTLQVLKLSYGQVTAASVAAVPEAFDLPSEKTFVKQYLNLGTRVA
jgi:Domain of unknown function (DUF1704)